MACVIKKILSVIWQPKISCFAAILSPTERVPSHIASSSDCRRESVLKGPGPPFLRCQVMPPVALVVIVSTRNHAMINAYVRERTGDRRSSPNRSFLMNPPGGIYQRPRKCTAAAIPSVTATR